MASAFCIYIVSNYPASTVVPKEIEDNEYENFWGGKQGASWSRWKNDRVDYLTIISSCVSVCMSRYWARGKFGEHERGVRVARGTAESNCSLLSVNYYIARIFAKKFIIGRACFIFPLSTLMTSINYTPGSCAKLFLSKRIFRWINSFPAPQYGFYNLFLCYLKRLE